MTHELTNDPLSSRSYWRCISQLSPANALTAAEEIGLCGQEDDQLREELLRASALSGRVGL